jgi:hypothetical protein
MPDLENLKVGGLLIPHCRRDNYLAGLVTNFTVGEI